MSEKKKQGSKVFLYTILIIFIIVFLGVTTAYLFIKRGDRNLKKNAVSSGNMESEELLTQDEAEEGIISYQGKKYRYNEDLFTVLFLGIDTKEELGTESLNSTGDQADTNVLFVLDFKNRVVRLINISRDTMTDIDIYSAEGEYFNTIKAQLALQYAYGDGKEESCELMMKAISKLMYGMPIHGYYAMNLKGIEAANDAIGGVQLTVLEDIQYEEENFSLSKGTEILLMGKTARHYVQLRNREVLGSNDLRMQRQKQYLNAFAEQLRQGIKEDITLPIKLYQQLEEYVVTNISLSEMSYLASEVLSCEFDTDNFLTVKGTIEKGENTKYEEFYVDETALYEMILEVFYEKVETIENDMNVEAH